MKGYWILVVLGLLLCASPGYASTYSISTATDFFKGNLQNGIVTLQSDGEVSQNCYLDPSTLTITSVSLPKALFDHATCKFGNTIVVLGGADINTSYCDDVFLNTTQNGELTYWQSGPKLPEKVCNHRAIKSGKYIFNFGGKIEAGITQNIYRSEIDFSNNTLGPWQNVGTMPIQLEKYAMASYGGRIYLLGGYNNTPGNRVFVTDVDPSGNLLGWQEINQLPQALFDLDVAVFGNQLWVVGGNNGTSNVSAVYEAEINPDGMISSWTTKKSYPISVARHKMVATSVGLIVTGGSLSSLVYYSMIREDEDIGAWSIKSLAANLESHSAIVNDSKLFLIGGKYGGTPTAQVISIPLSIYQPWKQSTSLPVYKGGSAAVGVGSYAYMSGGSFPPPHNPDRSSEIYKATIQSPGGFSDWQLAGYLPVSVTCHSLEAYQNRLYYFGGFDTNGNTLNTYYSDIINPSDGMVQNWIKTTTIPEYVTQNCSRVAYQGYLYYASAARVYYSKINADGSLGEWIQTESLSQEAIPYNMVVYNGEIYALLNTNPIRCQYATIKSNGSLTPWFDTAQVSFITHPDGTAFLENIEKPYIVAIDGAGNATKSEINSDGSLAPWQMLDKGYYSGYPGRGIYYNGAINVFSDEEAASQYLLPIKYLTALNLCVDLGALKHIDKITTGSTFTQSATITKYRLFDHEWSTWNNSGAGTNEIQINQNGQYLQLEYDIQTTQENAGLISDIQVIYSEIAAPTPTLDGFNGKVISDKYTYVYPNPVRGSLAKINVYTTEPAELTLKIFTTSGQLVYARDFTNDVTGNYQINWNCSNMANGVYLYKISAKGKSSGIQESVLKKLALIK